MGTRQVIKTSLKSVRFTQGRCSRVSALTGSPRCNHHFQELKVRKIKSNCKTTIRNYAEELKSAALVLLATSKQIRSSNLDHSQVFALLGSIKYQQPSIFLPQLFYVAFKRPPQRIWRSHCILYSGSLRAQLSIWCSNVSLFKSTGGLSVLDNADQEGKIPHCAGEMIFGNETDCLRACTRASIITLNSPKTI